MHSEKSALKVRKKVLKDQTIRLRVTSRQKQIFVDAADKYGQAMSAWILQTCLMRVAQDEALDRQPSLLGPRKRTAR